LILVAVSVVFLLLTVGLTSAGDVFCRILPDTAADRQNLCPDCGIYTQACPTKPDTGSSGCGCANAWCEYWVDNDICDWEHGVKVCRAVCNDESLIPYCTGAAPAAAAMGLDAYLEPGCEGVYCGNTQPGGCCHTNEDCTTGKCTVSDPDCITLKKCDYSGLNEQCKVNEDCLYGARTCVDGICKLVPPRDCCARVSISVPSSVNIGDPFTVVLTYMHDTGTTGGVHLHWLNDEADYISGADTYNYVDYNGNTYGYVECDSMSSGQTCTLNLVANEDTIQLYYRAWDWSIESVCPSDAAFSADYNRDPDSPQDISKGMCSQNCNPNEMGGIVSERVITCDSYLKTVGVGCADVGGFCSSDSDCAVLNGNCYSTSSLDCAAPCCCIIPTEGTCPGDLNDDNVVNEQDLNIPALVLGSSNPDADVNGDGVVDIADVIYVAIHFGDVCQV